MADRQIKIGMRNEHMRFRYGLKCMRGEGKIRQNQTGKGKTEHNQSRYAIRGGYPPDHGPNASFCAGGCGHRVSSLDDE